jgi:hypothetical protein
LQGRLEIGEYQTDPSLEGRAVDRRDHALGLQRPAAFDPIRLGSSWRR